MKSLPLLALLSLAVLPLGARAASAPVPAKTECASKDAAFAAAENYAIRNGGSLILTSGTPSMEPLIHGRTYVVVQKRSYASISKSDILLYQGRPNASLPDRKPMLHRAVMHDKYGWLMSGDNNRWTESWDRVTPESYLGTVVAMFAFPQA